MNNLEFVDSKRWGNCQNFMNHLVAQGLPPGAAIEPWMCV